MKTSRFSGIPLDGQEVNKKEVDGLLLKAIVSCFSL